MANWIKKIFLLAKPSLDNPTNPDTPKEEYPELVEDYSFTTGVNKGWVAINNGVISFAKEALVLKGLGSQAIYTIDKNIVANANYKVQVDYVVSTVGEIRTAIIGIREFKDNTLLKTNELNSANADKPYSMTFTTNAQTNKFEVYVQANHGSNCSVASVSVKRV